MPQPLTQEQKVAKLREMAEGPVAPAAVPAPAAPAAAGAQAPEPTTPAATTEKAASEAKAQGAPEAPAAAPAAPAAPAARDWKRKVKALDEEREIDLAAMSDAELDALVGRGLSHEPIKERYRAARDDAREQLERARRDVAARDNALRDLAAKGYTVEHDPSTGQIRVLAPAPQKAAPEAAAQSELDALEKTAFETGTAEAWRDYMRAIRKSGGTRNLTDDQVSAVVKQRLEEARAADRANLEAAQRQADEVTAFKAKSNGVFETHKASFEKAGPLADYWRQVARREAYLESGKKGATEESVLKVISDVAAKVEATYAHAQAALTSQAGQPRPKAPTVLAGGGAVAPAPSDPSKIDRTTPEGKKAAAELLRKQAEARRAPVAV